MEGFMNQNIWLNYNDQVTRISGRSDVEICGLIADGKEVPCEIETDNTNSVQISIHYDNMENRSRILDDNKFTDEQLINTINTSAVDNLLLKYKIKTDPVAASKSEPLIVDVKAEAYKFVRVINDKDNWHASISY